MAPQRLIVGVTGASGIAYGVKLLELLRNLPIETHLVMSRSAEVTLAYETRLKVDAVKALAHVVHRNDDMAAPISSGSFRTLGMVVAPCSVKTLAEIATGVTGSLLSRAADVVLKERRRLVLMLRETPLHLGHLRLMTQVTEAGAVLVPPLPAFYHKPKTLEDVIMQSVNKALDQFDLDLDLFQRWTGNEEREAMKQR